MAGNTQAPLVFDIETGPLDDSTLADLCPPFEPPPHPGEFDPRAVKVGNLKDEAKIRDKIAAAEAAHAEAVANYEADCTKAQQEHFDKFRAEAPLSALTGQVVAIGYMSGGKSIISGQVTNSFEEEERILHEFWQKYTACRAARRQMVGHNLKGFDVPFLWRRSRILNIPVPSTVYEKTRYLDSVVFRDTMEIWQGPTFDRFVGLDRLAKAFGIKGKFSDGGISGGEFHRFWFGSPEEHELARQYLLADLEATKAIAERMGVC